MSGEDESQAEYILTAGIIIMNIILGLCGLNALLLQGQSSVETGIYHNPSLRTIFDIFMPL